VQDARATPVSWRQSAARCGQWAGGSESVKREARGERRKERRGKEEKSATRGDWRQLASEQLATGWGWPADWGAPVCPSLSVGVHLLRRVGVAAAAARAGREAARMCARWAAPAASCRRRSARAGGRSRRKLNFTAGSAAAFVRVRVPVSVIGRVGASFAWCE